MALRSNNTNCHLCWGATENREDPILINTLLGEIKGFRVILESCQEEVKDTEARA